jgi:hypothetical protein
MDRPRPCPGPVSSNRLPRRMTDSLSASDIPGPLSLSRHIAPQGDVFVLEYSQEKDSYLPSVNLHHAPRHDLGNLQVFDNYFVITGPNKTTKPEQSCPDLCIVSSIVAVNQVGLAAPAAHGATIHVNEVGTGIAANATSTTACGCACQLIHRTALHTQIGRLTLKVQ